MQKMFLRGILQLNRTEIYDVACTRNDSSGIAWQFHKSQGYVKTNRYKLDTIVGTQRRVRLKYRVYNYLVLLLWVACDAKMQRQQTGGSGQRASSEVYVTRGREWSAPAVLRRPPTAGPRCPSHGVPGTRQATWSGPAAARRPARPHTTPASAPSAAPFPTRSRYVPQAPLLFTTLSNYDAHTIAFYDTEIPSKIHSGAVRAIHSR